MYAVSTLLFYTFGYLCENNSSMKEKIQQLVAAGKTEEALELLRNCTDEAVLLMGRYTGTKRQYNMGLIDFGEWQRVQNQVNYAALELAGNCKEGATQPAVVTDSRKTSAFISYNHRDSLAMQAVRNYLERNGVDVMVDQQDMRAGEEIESFINRAFDNNRFVLSIVSENSLRSGWVSVELNTAVVLNNRTSKWIPLSLDKSVFDHDFYLRATAEIEKEYEKRSAEMIDALQKKISIIHMQEEMARLEKLKANLGNTLAELRRVLIVDISGTFFDLGMGKVLETMKNG